MDKECIMFSLSEEIPDKATFQKLQQVLKQLGVQIRLQQTGEGSEQLCISWHEPELKQRRTRNAGRPYSPNSRKWVEIDQWRAQGMTPVQIAQKLGVSRATYYSRLREHRLDQDNSKEYFCPIFN